MHSQLDDRLADWNVLIISVSMDLNFGGHLDKVLEHLPVHIGQTRVSV
eukprot:COSAG02_NODE_753_length_17610_cov_23.119753_1_plen_47_part_10